MFGHGVFDRPMKKQYRAEEASVWNETIPVQEDYEDVESFDAALEDYKKKRETTRNQRKPTLRKD